MRFTAVLVAALWGCHPAAMPMAAGGLVAAAVPVGTTPSSTPLCESIDAQCTGGGTGSPWLALAVIAAVPAIVLLVSALTHDK